MSTRNIAGRFVVVISGVAVATSALAQVSPDSTYPAPPPAATGTYDPAQPAAPPTAAPVPTDPAAQVPPAPAPADTTLAQAPAAPADQGAPAPTQYPTQAPAQYPNQASPAYPTQAPAQYPTQAPSQYPTQVPAQYPTQVPGQMPAQMPGQMPMPAGAMPNGMSPPIYQMPAPSRVRNAFASTLGAILQNAASAGTLGLSQLVTGSITAWFTRKQNRLAGQPYGMPAGTPGYPQAYPTTDPYATGGQQTYPTQTYPGQSTYPTQPGYPTQTYPNQQAYPGQTTTGQQGYPTQTYPNQQAYPGQTQTAQSYPGQSYPQSAYPTTPGQPGYPATQPYGTPGTFPATPDANGMYTAASAYAPTTYYDPQTGQSTQAMAYPTANVTSTSDVYAGIAYEVHAVRPAVGDAVPVNPATYEFRTGDRFLVHYRPSMPGRMEVYNVNPLGQTTPIDSVNMAAGQLSTLGPYEFAANRGEESLRLVLTPCTTPQLLTATRDIINVSMSAQPAPSMQGGLQLGSCSGLATRGVGQAGKAGGIRTRDIRNVALDGGTSFALDPVSRQELSSGNLAPREVTIVFHHR